MPSPFPGMDPWLEDSEVFPDLHSALIIHLREALNSALPPGYVATSKSLVWVDDELRREPDVSLFGRDRGPNGNVGSTTTLTGLVSIGQERTSDPWEEPYLEILSTKGKRLVTAIEVLSRSNKKPGDNGRKTYQDKQQEFHLAGVNLVEIDLLRSGPHTTLVPFKRLQEVIGLFDYHISVMVGHSLTYHAAAIRLTDRLPIIGIPLDPDIPEVTVDLQPLLRWWPVHGTGELSSPMRSTTNPGTADVGGRNLARQGADNVNEDEAFIRAIVASPGGDTPRLVYADWLDDGNDPRGMYLRAELEWAKPWRAGERPGESLELREMASGLDLVWVARVSRPPVGVCCDHLRLTDSGPPISMQQLDTLENDSFASEAKYGGYQEPVFLGLPVDYRAFMLNQNGGECPRSSFPVPSTEEQPAYVAEACFRFWRFSETIPIDDPTGPWGSWLTVATYQPERYADKLLLRCDGKVAGGVYFYAQYRFQDWELDELPEVARSLSEFFAILMPLNCGSINPSTQHI